MAPPVPERRAWPAWPWLVLGAVALVTAACCLYLVVRLVGGLIG